MVEELVREVARELMKTKPGLRSRVDERLVQQVMKHPDLRTSLFQFAEAFPAMRTSDDVLAHLTDYLDTPGIPKFVRSPVRLAGRVPLGGPVAHRAAKYAIARMARQFIAGEDAADAAPTVKALWDQGIGSIVDALGEKTVTDEDADYYASRVLDLIETIGPIAKSWPNQPGLAEDHIGPLARLSVSIKPTATSPHLRALKDANGVEDAARRLRPILQAAVEQDVMVWFDMEQYAVKELSHRLFRQLADEFPNAHLGIIVQAYLRDSFADLETLISWARQRSPVSVRLVKGAYWDYETVTATANGWPIPVYSQKAESDINYEACSRLMNENADVIRPAYASHNLRSISHAIAHAKHIGLPDNAIEVQALLGMAEQLPEALHACGVRSRVYMPVGDLIPGMSYLVRRLLENTSNESFLRQSGSGMTFAELMAEPKLEVSA